MQKVIEPGLIRWLDQDVYVVIHDDKSVEPVPCIVEMAKHRRNVVALAEGQFGLRGVQAPRNEIDGPTHPHVRQVPAIESYFG
jgi:hypothetical protein